VRDALRLRVKRLVYIISVVPANAGTHNPWHRLVEKTFDAALKREDTAYGPRVRGDDKDELSRLYLATCAATANHFPFCLAQQSV
jgi:hypothetical protein